MFACYPAKSHSSGPPHTPPREVCSEVPSMNKKAAQVLDGIDSSSVSSKATSLLGCCTVPQDMPMKAQFLLTGRGNVNARQECNRQPLLIKSESPLIKVSHPKSSPPASPKSRSVFLPSYNDSLRRAKSESDVPCFPTLHSSPTFEAPSLDEPFLIGECPAMNRKAALLLDGVCSEVSDKAASRLGISRLPHDVPAKAASVLASSRPRFSTGDCSLDSTAASRPRCATASGAL